MLVKDDKIESKFDYLICARSVEDNTGVVVLEFTGMVNPTHLQNLKKIVTEEFAKGNYRLILNMSRMDYIDSPTLANLYYCCKEARQEGGDVRFACLTNTVKLAFETMHLTDIFKIYESDEKALASFSSEDQ